MRDIMLGVVAAAVEPIAGGRHKVFGRKELAVVPMTSTIASHLPRAVGIALADRPRSAARRARARGQRDAIVALLVRRRLAQSRDRAGGAEHDAQIAFQGLPLPLLFVCEDNGLGISVPSPPGGSSRR